MRRKKYVIKIVSDLYGIFYNQIHARSKEKRLKVVREKEKKTVAIIIMDGSYKIKNGQLKIVEE